MKYLGGKSRISKELSCFIIKKVSPEKVNGYLEPFCGSLSVFIKMVPHYKKCYASDYHPDLIKLWKEIQEKKFKVPKTVSNREYIKYKTLKSPNAKKAYIGFFLSFGGTFFGGFSQKYTGDSGRNFDKEAEVSIKKLSPIIQQKHVKFKHCSYEKWKPKNKLIYCDPPYKNTKEYKSVESFNHKKFWETMRKWSKNNFVFISEYTAPKDFVAVWKKTKQVSLDKNNKKTFKIEKLFVHKSLKL